MIKPVTMGKMGLSEKDITDATPWYDLMLREVERESTGWYGKPILIPQEYLRVVLLLLHVNNHIDRSTKVQNARVVVVTKVPVGSKEELPTSEHYYEVSLARLIGESPTFQGDPYNNKFCDHGVRFFRYLPCVVSLRGSTAELYFQVSPLSKEHVTPRKKIDPSVLTASIALVELVTAHEDFKTSGIPKGDIIVASRTCIELSGITGDIKRVNNNRRYIRPDRMPPLKALLFMLKNRGVISADTDVSKFPVVLFHGKGSYILRTLVSLEGNQFHSLPTKFQQAKDEEVKRLPHTLNTHYDTASIMLEDGTIYNFPQTPWKTTIYKFNLAELYTNCKQVLLERMKPYVK